MRGTNFTAAILQGALLEEAVLTNAIFKQANLTNVQASARDFADRALCLLFSRTSFPPGSPKFLSIKLLCQRKVPDLRKQAISAVGMALTAFHRAPDLW